jgi:hypothetical protein
MSWPGCLLEESLSYIPAVLKRQLDANINYNNWLIISIRTL